MNGVAAWLAAVFGTGVACVAVTEALGQRRRNRRVRSLLDARTADRDQPELGFLLGHEPLDDTAIADHAAIGIHDLTRYLAKEAEQ